MPRALRLALALLLAADAPRRARALLPMLEPVRLAAQPGGRDAGLNRADLMLVEGTDRDGGVAEVLGAPVPEEYELAGSRGMPSVHYTPAMMRRIHGRGYPHQFSGGR